MRHRLLVGVWVAAATVAAPLLASASGPSTTVACLGSLETRNAWHQIPTPRGLGVVTQLDDSQCDLLTTGPSREVQLSPDGGLSWHSTGSLPVAASRLIASGLSPATVLAVPARVGRQGLAAKSAPGLYLSTDRGRRFSASTGLDGVVVHDVAADVGNPSTLYAAGSSVPVLSLIATPGSPSIYQSLDGGHSWTGFRSSAPFQAVAVAVDTTDSAVLYAADSSAALGGLWVSADGGSTFVQKQHFRATSLDVAEIPGGGNEVYVGTSSGLRVTRDQGATVAGSFPGLGISAVRAESGHPSAAMLVTAQGLWRTSDTGQTSRSATSGLPEACDGVDLIRDTAEPSTFVISCSDGSPWRFRSDGSDFDTADSSPGTNSTSGLSLPPPKEMRELAVRRTPVNGDGTSGSIAFDGSYLYYSDNHQGGVVHRIDAGTGKDAGDIRTGYRETFRHLAYDSNRHVLYVGDPKANVLALDLRTLKLRRMFTFSPYGYDVGDFTFDAAIDRFVAIDDGSTSLYEWDLAGHQVSTCSIDFSGITSFVTVSGGGPVSLAAVVATGDGLLYGEVEDDSTVVRMDRGCHILAAYKHESFSEAGDENDAVACDTVTFAPKAAIWLRDADSASGNGKTPVGKMHAYEIPGGYCALQTRMTLSSPGVVDPGQVANVCATLKRAATGQAVPGQQIGIFVADRALSPAVTDPSGVACAPYSPIQSELPPVAHGTRPGLARHGETAVYLGSPAFRTAVAHSVLDGSGRLAQRAPVHALPVLPALAQLQTAPVPAAQAPPQPPAPPQAQAQPLAQGHPGVQPGAAGAAGAAPAPDDEVQIEAQGAETSVLSFTAWDDPAYPVVVAAAVIVGLAVIRRRRASRVTTQRG